MLREFFIMKNVQCFFVMKLICSFGGRNGYKRLLSFVSICKWADDKRRVSGN
jgi:hypothetical protein